MKITKALRILTALSNLSVRDFCRLMVSLPFYLYKTLSGTRYTERRIHDYRMLLDLRDEGISKDLMLLGTREKEHIIFLQQELEGGMVVLDIGANIGYYSIMMGKLVGELGKVYAVEPSLSNYHLLNLNIQLNNLEDTVETFRMGISNTTGTGEFYQSAKSNWHTFYPMVHSGTSTESLVDTIPIPVPVMTIGDFAKGRRKIEFIRMDIEGYEVEVFEDIVHLLQGEGFHPKILFEVHQPRYDDQDHNMRQGLKNLFKAGYYVKMLASTKYTRGVSQAFLKKGYTPKKVIRTDYLQRGIFTDVSNDDAAGFICDTDYVRTVLLDRRN